MKTRISLQLTLDDQRLAYLLETRIISVEDLGVCDPKTKTRVKALLLRNALKNQQS